MEYNINNLPKKGLIYSFDIIEVNDNVRVQYFDYINIHIWNIQIMEIQKTAERLKCYVDIIPTAAEKLTQQDYYIIKFKPI